MYTFLKFKAIDEYSLNDLKNNTISFGLYSIFSGQNELKGKIDVDYLKKKYNDDSITKDNLLSILTNHIDEGYLQFSLTKFDESFNEKENASKMYQDYSKGRGFIVYYEFDSIEEIKKSFVQYLPVVRAVEYGAGEMDLTTFYDCMLETPNDPVFNLDAFIKLLKEKGHEDDLIQFMVRKTDYNKSYENEARIVIQRNEGMMIINGHIALPFVKPSLVLIPSSLGSKDRYDIAKICKKKKIFYKYIQIDDACFLSI